MAFTWDRQTQFQLDGLPFWAEDWIFDLTLVVWQGQLWNLPFFLVMPAGKRNPGSPLGLGFGHLQDDWTAPGGCHPSGTELWHVVPAPLSPSLKGGESGSAAVYSGYDSQQWHYYNSQPMTNSCRETQIHVTSLCRGMGRFLNCTLKYCSEWDVKICQVEPSDRRWWNAGWSWWSFVRI